MRTRSAFGPLLLAFVACSDAPRAPRPSPPVSAQLPPGHPELPADHPDLAGPAIDPEAVFSGTLRLAGPLAEVRTGFVFFSVRPKGQRGPLLGYRIDLADPDLREPVLVRTSDGTRELNFLLNQRTSMMPGAVPRDVALEFQVMYDPDGDIDTQDGRYETVVPTKIGDELSLDLPASG